MAKVLVADDERAICEAFCDVLRAEDHVPIVASTGDEALALVEAEQPAAVFLDVRMPGRDGLSVLKEIHASQPELPVVMMTAYGTVDTAMQAMRDGAFDYLGKPVDLQRIRDVLSRALHKPASASATVDTAAEPPDMRRLVGRSAAMQEIFKLMGLLPGNDLTVLITGESGVGKELVARAIHNHGQRRDQPFVAVNCAAIPVNLMESELFGHERGAFTDAREQRAGRFESAGTGSVFLDEISELPYPLQSKLLRVLQERSFERIGSVKPQPLRARIIAASNRRLDALVEQGRFREDLYHRLDLVTLHIPPLRKRREDIEALTEHFLRMANHQIGKHVRGVEDAVLRRLTSHSWPGNVRVLVHTIKRAVLVARGELITVHDVEIKQAPGTAALATDTAAMDHLRAAARNALHQAVEETDSEHSVFQALVSTAERAIIDEALAITDGNQTAASRLLGLHRTTMRKKLQE